ncbi:protein FAR-RED ELONGATED HYPOCOTYL 3-like [Argentina anserina]|uniref:protein FAR-RED ELONGATED HYPOCOTYL 3-like n=1 Tax=Argentina anserina TaxID=57926 RepID=UPI0021767B6B|nr:protein FAR-RED ELONGATED HYPOCOTYL 3-like [Potentilla anserina]
MSTTQRSESMNSFFDGHVNSKTTLKQFVEQYENALRSKVEKENHEDFKCFSYSLLGATHYDMEVQAHDIYTISKFKEFRDELTGKMYCDFIFVEVDNSVSEYIISEDIKVGEMKKTVHFQVSFNEESDDIHCNCCLFQFRGILCRHAIYVLIHHKKTMIPDKYIMRRWRKDVKRCHTMVKISYGGWDARPDSQRLDKMQKNFDDIKELAYDSEDKCMIVLSCLNNLKDEVSKHESNTIGACGGVEPVPGSPINTNGCEVDGISNPSQHILTPLVKKRKGRPPSKRKVSKVEEESSSTASRRPLEKNDFEKEQEKGVKNKQNGRSKSAASKKQNNEGERMKDISTSTSGNTRRVRIPSKRLLETI